VLHNFAEKRIKRLLKTSDAGLSALHEILREMQEGGRNSEFAERIKVRRTSRVRAQKVLKQIHNAPRLSTSKFLKLYGELAGGLWRSGGLHRSKTRIATDTEIFQQIVRVAAGAIDRPIVDTYEQLNELAKKTTGVGPNVLTEILQTYNNHRFAVMNQNSVAGMKLAGILNFPDKPNKNSVDGKLYDAFCRRADSLRRKLGLTNLSELDAVFDYAYWRQDEDGNEDE
jgi:hypothetical protein